MIILFIGIIYSIIIFLACILGAIVGLGGGVFIRPIFDAIGYHPVLDIGFFSSTAILSMAVVSTVKKMRDGTAIDVKKALLISAGALLGGMLGNLLLEHLLAAFGTQRPVQYMQIIATIVVLIFSLILTAKSNMRYELKSKLYAAVLGVALGAIASFLGIGGGPINVPLMMIFFGLNIKDATAYSIIIIFFSHLSRIITLGVTVGYAHFDLSVLPYVIIAAAAGGLVGARLSKTFSEATVRKLFQGAICIVILLNIVNGLFLI
ncbi:MAG: sulfite exporter TauE/SafE family protein [Defluviitaleaceae bacterium]|nr:sulfite exporter TauE/SafE family protein [Defluviitaleaceae bacterium]